MKNLYSTYGKCLINLKPILENIYMNDGLLAKLLVQKEFP